MLNRFHLIPERHGQTDGQNCYINIARQCADAREKFMSFVKDVDLEAMATSIFLNDDHDDDDDEHTANRSYLVLQTRT